MVMARNNSHLWESPVAFFGKFSVLRFLGKVMATLPEFILQLLV